MELRVECMEEVIAPGFLRDFIRGFVAGLLS